MKQVLTVYYSYSNGNTQRIAELAHRALGGEIVRIQTEIPYSGDYDDVVRQGQEEVQQGYRPPIQPLGINLAEFDTIVVGTPTWWYTMAPAVLTFLESNDWEGKTVIPFATHGGWPGHVLKDMKKACKNAVCCCEKEIQFDSDGGDRLVTEQQELQAWIESLQAIAQEVQ